MNRRQFIGRGCGACLGAVALGTGLSGCATTRYAATTLTADGVRVALREFVIEGSSPVAYRPFVVVRDEALRFPICVFRFGETDYSALWMQCAHQGAELQASGTALQCPAHGSEFDSRGQVTNGPAAAPLRSFPVRLAGHDLFLDLRAAS
ncbi:Rieske (2Fe-2S) protein [Hymenobacter qilianensis]|uniref:Rieske 2Fe-2S domain-containing protein n=1 Tax=Hymenobacter qilianensis TaxID=1385715 RepID=A0A7H0H1R9_9BACT|nr:Rieske 2Fe-2S domain-containing protein [Hymenobacter qilianensis]QNP54485.1 Rieske 2Fe-2S domain-containing protein [Hymenobacter qilianensis]